jgi:hypothetical protein
MKEPKRPDIRREKREVQKTTRRKGRKKCKRIGQGGWSVIRSMAARRCNLSLCSKNRGKCRDQEEPIQET